jgi:alpha-tubulin suppressor-like RCC1 family protein
MVNYICTRFKDSDGLDLGCHLIPKEYLLEKYPNIQQWVKAPALWGWGYNLAGNLGDNTNTASASPVQTFTASTNWRNINAGRSQSAAIKSDGTLWLWGDGAYGALGNNSTIPRSSPVQTISGGTNWKSISVGDYRAVAIKSDGTLWAWGRGTSGALGDNTTLNKSSPVQTISGTNTWCTASTSVLGSHTGAIKTDGTLWMWGLSNAGQLGTGNTTSHSSPVQTFSGGTNWKSISTGACHTAAIKTDGTLWTWGINTSGVLGDNTIIGRAFPVQTISLGNNWNHVSAGERSTAAIKTDGTLWLWGQGSFGRLGNNSTINRSSPVQTVSGGTNWFKVSNSYYGVAAIKTDGSLWMWGDNSYGRLGTNVINARSSPIQTISGGTNWKDVSAGRDFTFAIKDEGDY